MGAARRDIVCHWCIAVFLAALFLCPVAGCSGPSSEKRTAVDHLNDMAYASHYRYIDVVDSCCKALQSLADGYADGTAERYNNEAFARMVKMDYHTAKQCLDTISELTDNQLELLVSYVQQMRLCQRQSRNKDFYDYRQRALLAQRRINEERGQLSPRQQRRLLYAESELAIVTSTYYYYVGLEQQSVEALMRIDEDAVKQDTAQFLNYLYNIGAGGIITEGTATEIYEQEMSRLLRCFQIAQHADYPYFIANALEGIAEHLLVMPDDADVSLVLVNPFGLSDDELAVWLADEALKIFEDFGDVYQIAGAYRTLASCCRDMGDNEGALYNLHQALADTTIMQAPDLVASIYEQLSVAYAAIDDKQHSDYYRNMYLDLQEQTRQDRQLEARADQLDKTVTQLNWIVMAAIAAIILTVVLLWLFRWLSRRHQADNPLELRIEERREELAMSRLHIEESSRRHLEQRAKISLVNSLLPLIDRMVYTIRRKGDIAYVKELTDKINADNELLTQWIQLRQGQLSLHIESFQLAPLFDMMTRSQKSFMMKGITLHVAPTESVVKADRILTLFMLNTLADNARKFTPEGGSVDISATEGDGYVEISVSDTGCGMDAEQLAHVFEHRVIVDEKMPESQAPASHGYGLLNCKGIMERYRKMSQLFSVCTLQAESEKGRGSRFFFRLPIGRVLGVLMAVLIGWTQVQAQVNAPLSQAAIYADSAFFSNINGTYERTLLFADSCRECLNAHYLKQYPKGRILLQRDGDISLTAPEIRWLHDSLATNYNIILDIRNESAVAALALHEWQLYQYNNRIYIQLYKELSADATLADYCRTMQQTKVNRAIAAVLLLLALLSVVPIWYFFYLRPRLYKRYQAEWNSREDLELLDDEQRRADLELQNLHVSNAVLDNCLSTLKHETMYYPSRIRQLIEQGDMEAAEEVVEYYRELYNMLGMQAQSQVERVKLHLEHLDHDILGDRVLIAYLCELIKRMAGASAPDISYQRHDNRYVQMSCSWPLHGEDHQIDYLLCRQIVRDHGEATNRRACSISMKNEENITHIIILLPAYGKL